jgi:hypothetical protein
MLPTFLEQKSKLKFCSILLGASCSRNAQLEGRSLMNQNLRYRKLMRRLSARLTQLLIGPKCGLGAGYNVNPLPVSCNFMSHVPGSVWHSLGPVAETWKISSYLLIKTPIRAQRWRDSTHKAFSHLAPNITFMWYILWRLWPFARQRPAKTHSHFNED